MRQETARSVNVAAPALRLLAAEGKPTFPASSHVTSKGRRTPEFRIFTPNAGAP